MSKHKLEKLTWAFKEKNFKKGAYLYRECNRVDGVYFLIKGTLERVKED
jgi:signal-transduction protein with cAMP-binding, CBS, and nucleotidyltransferase domain